MLPAVIIGVCFSFLPLVCPQEDRKGPITKEGFFHAIETQLTDKGADFLIELIKKRGLSFVLSDSDVEKIRGLQRGLGKTKLNVLIAAIKSNYQPIVYLKPRASQTFDFNVLTVNAKGTVIEQRKGKARYFIEDLGGGVTLTMVEIPAGVFQMGSSESDVQGALVNPKLSLKSFESEMPKHQVKVPTFFMSKFEVTQAQWRAIADIPKVKDQLKTDPSHFRDDEQHPVEQVSWEDAVEFCARLTRKTGRTYRLPTEAEWEYACRAGTTTPFAFGETITSALVNYQSEHPYADGPKGRYRQTTIAVGSLGVANGFGLYDMHGNVMELCLDVWHGDYDGAPADGGPWMSGDRRYRVVRGGGFLNDARLCRCASRGGFDSDKSRTNIGFRVVAVVQP